MLEPSSMTPTALPLAATATAPAARTGQAGLRDTKVQATRPAPVPRQPVVVATARKRKKRYKTTTQVLRGAQALIKAVGKRIANREVDGQGADDLKALLELGKLVEDQAALIVAHMRENGMTDREIGKLLPVMQPDGSQKPLTKQAVQKRWPRAAPAQEGGDR